MTVHAAERGQFRRGRQRQPPRDILNVRVSYFAWDEATGALKRFVSERIFTRVAFLNAHGANLATVDGAFAAALKDFLVLPDGIGVDMASKVLHGRTFPANLNGTDFVPALLAAITAPVRVGLIGARRENGEGAIRELERIAPQHSYVLISDGFFSPTDEPAILERVAELRPDILLVAMGMPQQELWIAKNITAEHCTVPIAVGALLDFLSGAVPRAPRWMRRLRLEWLYRLGLEPRRLWRRYVLGNPLFVGRVLGAKLGLRREMDR